MDRAREVKRGGNRHLPAKQRQPKASGHKLVSALNGGDVELLERSKKERVRGSSNEDNEMMGGGSEGEEEFRLLSNSSNRRFKLKAKGFDDCNAVDPAAVPRRLRSAMNKRNHESVSPPLPDTNKNNYALIGTELPHVNGVKRSKLYMKLGGSDRSPKQVLLNAITKDEEEVAEALYALAGMVEEPAKSKIDGRTVEASMPIPLPEIGSSLPPSEALKEDSTGSPNVLADSEGANLASCKEESSAETVNVGSIMGPNVSEQPISSGGQKFKLELNDVAQEDAQGIDLSSKDEQTEHMQRNDAVTSFTPMEVPSESYPGNRLLEIIQPEYLPVKRLDSVPLPAVAVEAQQEAKPVKENVESCTRLQEGAPDLRHAMPKGLSDGLWHLTQTSSTKARAWPYSANCASRPGSTGNDVSKEKLALVSVGRRQSFKRCAFHVYISRFIRAFQSMDKKSSCPPSVNQSKSNEGIKSGITASNDPTVLKTGMNNVMSVGAHGLVADRKLHEARLGTLQDNKLLQDQQASTPSGIYPQQKQSSDFLSLSAGGESNKNPGNGFESSAQLHVPYLHSFVQHPIMPFSLPHTRYSSSYPDQLAAQQVQLQLQQYSGNPFYGPQLAHGSSAKQQQHQQQLWSAQMAHYRPCNPSSSHLSKWQNGRHDAPCLIPCSQAIVPPSPSSLEVIGPKYMPNPQQLFAVSSSSPSRAKRQHHTHPSSYDEGGAGFCSDGPPHLQQLLCNAQNM